jgi:glutaredoxin 2
MRLYMFEHCSLCFRVRTIAALKRVHLQDTVVLDDDSDTMVGLTGKRVIPILVKDCGQPMVESMDMVSYVDDVGERVLTGPERRRFPHKVREYFESMMSHIGYQPLPAV